MFLLGVLSACVETPTVAPTTATAEPPAIVALPGLTPTERLRRGLQMLEDGDEATARAELVAYLRATDNSRTGRSLLRQIDTPVDEYFPAEFREVILRKDQSLSNIAQTYLGSALEFHALAKYNGIEQPRHMFPGQIVKVPLTKAATNAFDELEDALDEPALDSQPLIEMLNSEPEQTVDAAFPSSTDSDSAVASPESPESPEDMTAKTIENRPSAAEEVTAREVVDAPPETAAAVTGEASSGLAVSPPSPEAAPDIDVDSLHRQAINAYRAQDLDTAISIWNRVLEADPSYEGARLYRSQALALKKRLSSFN